MQLTSKMHSRAANCKLSLWLNMRVECSVEVFVNKQIRSNIWMFCIQLHLDWTLLTKYTTAYNQTNFGLKCSVEVLVNTQSRSTYNLHRKQNLLPSEQTSNVEHLIWRTTNKCFNKQGMGTNDISECDIWLNHSRQNFFVVCGKLLSTPEVFILPFLLSPRRCLELLRVLLWF